MPKIVQELSKEENLKWIKNTYHHYSLQQEIVKKIEL